MSASPDNRRLACEFLIAAAVCGGAYYFVVDSAKTKIAAVRVEAVKAQQEEASHAGIGGLSDAQVSDLTRTTAERVADMKARSAPAIDESSMFTRISELATANTVRIEQLNPVQMRTENGQHTAPQAPSPQAGTPAAQAAAEGPPVPHDIRAGYSMSVTGKYPDLVAFIGALSERLGYTIIKSVRLSQPDLRTPDVLRVAIETEHIALDLSAIRVQAVPAATRQPMPIAGVSETPGESQATHGTREEANAQP